MENRGEGVFLELAPEAITRWETLERVSRKAAKLDQAYRASWAQRTDGSQPPPKQITPRFILLHSMAHSLMKDLGLECGYSSTSLRERIYAGTPPHTMSGILVYTSTADSDGTLGGLARQGEGETLGATLARSLQSLRWCSSDPLCIEGVRSLSDPLNGAACHACLLASETSCEEFNCFLDRSLVVGTLSEPDLGFMTAIVATGN